MPHFTITLTLRGDNGQKSYWENVAKELREKGARIIDVQSKVARVGEPPITVNLVTITYSARRRIELERYPL